MGKFYEGLCEELTPIVQAIAWLNTTPNERETEVAQRKTVSQRKFHKPERVSRGEALRASGEYPDLPEVEGGGYLIGYLVEAGPVSYVGMGSAPLTWADIEVWQKAIGLSIEPWEKRILRRLSGAYLKQQQLAEEPDCPPPWSRTLTTEDRTKVSNKLQSALRDLIKTRPNR